MDIVQNPIPILKEKCPVLDFETYIKKFRCSDADTMIFLINKIKNCNCDVCFNHPFKGKLENCHCLACKNYKLIDKVLFKKDMDFFIEGNKHSRLYSYFYKIIKSFGVIHFDPVIEGCSYYRDNFKVHYVGHYSSETRNPKQNLKLNENLNRAILNFYPMKPEKLTFLLSNYVNYKNKDHFLDSRRSSCDCEICNICYDFYRYIRTKDLRDLYLALEFLILNWFEYQDRILYNELMDELTDVKKAIKVLDGESLMALIIVKENILLRLRKVQYTSHLKIKILKIGH